MNKDYIELKDLIGYLYIRKLKIIIVTGLFALFSVVYALSRPNMYTTEVVLSPSSSQKSGGLQALSSQFGGIAALAGFNLDGGSGSRIEESVVLLESWPFMNSFMSKYDFKPSIIAVDFWSAESNKLVFKPELYNSESREWLFEDGETLEPSDWDTFKKLMNDFSVTQNSKNGLVTLRFEHVSPEFSLLFLENLVSDINKHFQELDVSNAKRNIVFLERQIENTNYKDMQTVFFSMLEEQTKILMLADSDEDYVFTTLVPGKQAEEKSSPSRALICIAITMGGFIFSVIFFLINFLYIEMKK